MNVILILEKLESAGLIRLNRKIGDWYQIYCPFHNNGEERKPSCGVSLTSQVRNGSVYPEGLFHCFTCGYAKPVQEAVADILKLRSIPTSSIDWLVANVPGFEAPSTEETKLIPSSCLNALNNSFALKWIQDQLDRSKIDYVSEDELASYRYTVPYMYERGLTDEIIADYDIGVDMKWIPPGRKKVVPCITFPVRDAQGRTLFICRRSIEGKLYNYPQAITKPVYGVDMLPKGCRSVIICESCFNALTAVKYGYPAVALLGTGNAYQIQQLKELGVREYVLCMDGDEAGRKASAKLKRELRHVALIWTIHMPDGKDLNMCSKSEFDKLYEERD